MNRVATRFAAALALIVAFIMAASAQRPTPPGTVTGKITDEEGKNVRDAVVKFLDASGNAGPEAKTNRRGEFTVTGLAAGTYRVVVEAKNYLSGRGQAEVSASAGSPPLAITLKKENPEEVKTLNELLQEADKLRQQGKGAESRAAYQKVLDARPDRTDIHKFIASTYGAEQNFKEALKHLDMALADHPNDAVALQMAAASAVEVGDTARAVAYLEKVADAEFKDAEALSGQAAAMYNKKQFADALKVLDRTIKLFPEAAMTYYFRGLTHYQLKNTDQAKADLEKYVSMAPADSPQVKQAKEIIASLKPA